MGFRPGVDDGYVGIEQASAADSALLLLHEVNERGQAVLYEANQRGSHYQAPSAGAMVSLPLTSTVAQPPSTQLVVATSAQPTPSGGSFLGSAMQYTRSSLQSAGHAFDRMIDDVSLALSDNPLANALGGRPTPKVNEPLRVIARLRPSKPPLGRRSERVSCAHGAIRVRGTVRGASPAMFQLDALLEEAASQEVAYAHGAGTLVPRLLAGRRCACLFLGQSGSGKTHAAFGSPALLADFHSHNDLEWGAAPRASRQLFDTLGEAIGAAGPLELSITWYEVRQGNQVVDLLAATTFQKDSTAPSLRIRESPNIGPYVKGLRRVAVERHDQVLALLAAGARRRALYAAKTNLHSSRATSFFTMHLAPRAAARNDPPLPSEPSLTLIDVTAMPPSSKKEGSGNSSRAVATGGGNSSRRSTGGSHSKRGGKAATTKSDSRTVLGAAHGALAECVELLHGAQVRDEPSSSLAALFRRHPVTKLLQPYLIGECTTTAVLACSVAESDLPATLACLRLGVLLRSTTTSVQPSVPPLLPHRARPPAVAAILDEQSPPRPPPPPVPQPPPRLPPPPPAALDRLLEEPEGQDESPLMTLVPQPPLQPFDLSPDSTIDTAQIRAIREHASALQRHLTSTQQRVAMEDAALRQRAMEMPMGDGSGLRPVGEFEWSALYNLGEQQQRPVSAGRARVEGVLCQLDFAKSFTS